MPEKNSGKFSIPDGDTPIPAPGDKGRQNSIRKSTWNLFRFWCWLPTIDEKPGTDEIPHDPCKDVSLMPRTPEQAYAELTTLLKQTALLESCASVLGWDEQTYMPPGGAAHRANQLSLLAGLCPDRATSPLIGELIAQIQGTPLLRATP